MLKNTLNFATYYALILWGLYAPVAYGLINSGGSGWYMDLVLIVTFWICLVISLVLTIFYVLVCTFIFKKHLHNFVLLTVSFFAFLIPVLWLLRNQYHHFTMNGGYLLLVFLLAPWFIAILFTLYIQVGNKSEGPQWEKVITEEL